jgi:2-oxoglutarate ferredoxin oxidoreductase subunit delta
VKTGKVAKHWKTANGWINIVEDECKGCGFCIEFCPRNALEESEGYNQKGYHFPEMTRPEECVNCGYCQLLCPEFAIWGDIEEDQDDE